MKRHSSIPVVLATIIVVLSGCATPPTTPSVVEEQGTLVVQPTSVAPATPVAQQARPTEEAMRLVTPGKITIGYVLAPSQVELQPDGTMGGVMGSLGTEIASRLGLEPVLIPFSFPMIIPALQSHRIDMYVGGFSVTQPRAQILYYGPAYLLQPETMAVNPGSQLVSWEEAKQRDLTLASVIGTFQTSEWENMGIKFHEFDTQDSCFLDVANGGSFGCSVGLLDQIYRREKNPDSPMAKLDTIVISGPRIIADLNAFANAKDNPALARAIAQITTDLWREGRVEAIYRQVFATSDISFFLNPPEGEAFYIPGPWEEGSVPPASESYPEVTTLSPGELTVGVAADSPGLRLESGQLVGPEAEILAFVAGKLGLKLKGASITDAVAALQAGSVDLIAGALPATKEGSYQYWQSTPIGFNPDYIYVIPTEGGGYPGFGSWEDIQKAGGKIAIVAGNSRIADLHAAGADVLEVADASSGLKALVEGSALGFVGSSLDYAVAISKDPELANANIGWVRNVNLYSYGEAYIWGVKAGNGDLLDALNQGITAAYQQKAIASAYGRAFPGANITALTAPGPTAIGTSWGQSKDYLWRSMWLPGPWLQRPGWVK